MRQGGDAPAATRVPSGPARARQLVVAGGKNPARGGYLRTVDNAPLNAMTFQGYTIEAFVKLTDDGRTTRGRVC